MNELTISNRHEVFLEGVLSGMELDKAGKKAGFVHPARDAYPLLAEPQTRAYFKKKIRGKAETEGLAVAYAYLIQVIRDTTVPTRTRVDAAKFVYGTHMPAVKATEANPEGEKSPSEMSNEELRQFIEQGEAELAERATPVNPDPLNALG